MTIIEDLCNDEKWDDFLLKSYRGAKKLSDSMRMISFVKNREYRPIVEAIAQGTYVFGDPLLKEIPKSDGRMRRVYSFKPVNFAEHMVLRMINRLLQRYNHLFAPNLYSEAKNHGVEGTIFDLLTVDDLRNKYFFKFDITDYGNSILLDPLFEILRRKLDPRDEGTIKLIENILRNPNVVVMREVDGKKKLVNETIEHKGAMPGVPMASFLFSIYIADMDWHFHNLGIPYYRFNDDILMVADTEEEILSYKTWVIDYITRFGLSTNEKKMLLVAPNEGFDHIGLHIEDGEVSITTAVVARKKKRIKDRAVLLNKRVIHEEMSRETAMSRMIDYLYKSFYDPDSQYSFSRTYFQRVSCSKHMGEIDSYAQDCIRYVYTGRFRNTNRIRVPYSELTKRGYLPLVSAYRMYREGKLELHTRKRLINRTDDVTMKSMEENDGL